MEHFTSTPWNLKGMKNIQAIVVVDTTWLFKNLRKLRVDIRTVNMCVGSGGSASGFSSSCAIETKKKFSTSTMISKGEIVRRMERRKEDAIRTLRILTICPFRLRVHALRLDRHYQALIIVSLEG